MNKYTAGIIGCGFGEQHIKWLKQCEHFEVKWLAYQSNQQRATTLADFYGIPTITNRPEEFIPDVDCVVIVTPVCSHFSFAQKTILQKKMVVCDKPLAMDSKEAATLVEMVRKDKIPNMILFQMRFNKYFLAMKEILDQDLLGKIHFIHCEFYHDFILGSELPTWRHDPSKSGCGAFGDMGVHLIDIVQWLFKDQMDVCFVNKKNTGNQQQSRTEDYGTACFRLAKDGIDGVLSISRTVKEHHLIKMMISGSKGTAILEINPSTNQGRIQTQGFSLSGPIRMDREENPYFHWWAHLERGSDIPTFEDGLKAQKIMDKIVTYER